MHIVEKVKMPITETHTGEGSPCMVPGRDGHSSGSCQSASEQIGFEGLLGAHVPVGMQAYTDPLPHLTSLSRSSLLLHTGVRPGLFVRSKGSWQKIVE